jgi:uncharacterized protein (UPF0333 family)
MSGASANGKDNLLMILFLLILIIVAVVAIFAIIKNMKNINNMENDIKKIMNNKQDIIGIITAIVIIIAFFLPWLGGGGFGMEVSVSAFNIVKEIIELGADKHAPEEISFYLPLLLTVLPIGALLFIVNEFSNSKRKVRNAIEWKILLITIMIFFIIAMSYGVSKSGMNLFGLLKVGFYFTLISSIYLFITVFIKKQPGIVHEEQQNNKKFCSNCGKQYDAANAGQFCEGCGTKLNK